MGRRASREMAMKLLYQLEIQKEDREEQKSLFFEENTLPEKDRTYISEVVDGFFQNKDFIDNMIEVHSRGLAVYRRHGQTG
jgi:N utilization substance protein B